MACLLAILFLVCSWGAQATAPRVAPQMFGEEKKSEIVGYQLAPAGAEGGLMAELVTEAFKAAGKSPALDVLPSRQLATYALFSQDAVALIGRPQDVAARERRQYHMVTFYLDGDSEEPVMLIFSKARGNALYQAFSMGMQTILRNGKYLEILERHRGQGRVPADYAGRLKRHNPGWK